MPPPIPANAAPIAAAEKLLDRLFALAETAGEHDGRIEREQRRREIAIGRRREQVAADGRRLAHRRSADRARHGMQKSQFALRQNRGHRHAGAKLDAAGGQADMQQARIGRAHDGLDRRVGFVDRAHHQRAATEKPRAALA